MTIRGIKRTYVISYAIDCRHSQQDIIPFIEAILSIPRHIEGRIGVLFPQDGLFPLVVDVFNDNEFWEKEVGYPKPHIEGLGRQKLIKTVKPVNFENKGVRSNV